MTKNYVIWTNCDIVGEKQRKFNIEPCSSPERRSAYDRMFKMSQASAKKFLLGDWETVVFTEPAETRVDMFRNNWQRIWDLWHKEPCNILYLDSDTLFIRPTEIFGRFKEFRLFNWTDPKTHVKFKDYFNAGVRYYPQQMDPAIWTIGQRLAKDWSVEIWDQEQLIFNEMFWSQPIAPGDHRHPELNWQGMGLLSGGAQAQASREQWNGLPVSRAHILHVHGSRGAVNTSMLMEHICKQSGITLDQGES
jgi:hypothetical protein